MRNYRLLVFKNKDAETYIKERSYQRRTQKFTLRGSRLQ